MRKKSALEQKLHRISAVTLNPADCSEAMVWLSQLKDDDLDGFLQLVTNHHVTIRTLEPLLACDSPGLRWSARARQTIVDERERIRISVEFLNAICGELEAAGGRVVIFKTLDHWPDFGNDLDLFVTGDEVAIQDVLIHRFQGVSQVRSWGDHLAHKWSFKLPGCPADVELHINRLGQAGEHFELAARFTSRRRYFNASGQSLPVPAPEERVIAAALQRMYRHLYFRICDIVNLTSLMQSGELSYRELVVAADVGGIWPGVAGCLELVADYANQYLPQPLRLPVDLQSTGNWSASKLRAQGCFMHIPFLPDGAGLFCRQFAHTAAAGNLDATARLSLLPPLASVAALAYAVTGSNGRIW
jgi:hypothetical protein